MLPKARLLPGGTPFQAIDWSGQLGPGLEPPSEAMSRAAGLPDPPPAAPIPHAQPPPSPAAAPDAEVVSADQQAHLAALEREAFTKGYAQGERAGLEAGGKRAEAMLRRVAQTIEELAGFRQTLIQQTERQMVQLALTLARRVVHREVSLDPELAAALAHVALEKLGTTTPATIRLNPEDYTVVAREGEPWGSSTVTVVPDPAIARGGCLVESDFGCVDATIERQFDELSRALLGDH
jgi:flagellar assembly protein FliH